MSSSDPEGHHGQYRHVVVSLKSLQMSEPFWHEVEYDNGTFRPACGTAISTPVLARLTDIPTMGSRSTRFFPCSKCRDQS